jgi:hypothetical protein
MLFGFVFMEKNAKNKKKRGAYENLKNARVRNEISPQGNEKCPGQGMKNIESRNEKPPKGNEKFAGQGMKNVEGRYEKCKGKE